jgi:hypothetical protein
MSYEMIFGCGEGGNDHGDLCALKVRVICVFLKAPWSSRTGCPVFFGEDTIELKNNDESIEDSCILQLGEISYVVGGWSIPVPREV